MSAAAGPGGRNARTGKSRSTTAIVAPVTEEATKGLFVLLLLWFRRRELDGVLDGLVYAGLVGVGFAFVENILYLADAYDGAAGAGGVGAVAGTLVVRCLFSPFAHPLFTAFTGIGIGIAVGARGGVDPGGHRGRRAHVHGPGHAPVLGEYDDAVRLPRLNYMDLLSNNLSVMDHTAATLCSGENLPIVVFDILKPGNLRRVLQGERVGSLVWGTRLP